MILISEALLIDYYTKGESDLKVKISQQLNNKIYTVKDTSLSYRQVNSLDSDNMLWNERDNEKGWRKFSFKDLVYLYTINECRKYRIENNKLQELKNDFYNQDKGTAKFSSVDHVLLLVLGSIKISLLINSKGNSYFADINYQTFIDDSNESYLYINFNEIVRKVWKLTHKGDDSKFAEYKGWGDLLLEYFSTSKLSNKEQEILNILRNNDYSIITIKKKDNDIFNVYGEVENNTDGISEMELLATMQKKDFTNINITKRDGKIVNYKIEDIYKI